MIYTASAWYWIVAGSSTQVYSSAGGAYVPITDSGYVAWLAAGNRPSRIASEAELSDVLAAAGVPAASIGTPAQQAAVALTKGLTVTATITPALSGTYDVSDRSRVNMMAQEISVAQTGNFSNQQSTINWPDMSGAMHTFNVAQFKALVVAVGVYYTALFFVEQSNTGPLPSASATIAV